MLKTLDKTSYYTHNVFNDVESILHGKTKHNITLSSQTWNALQALKRLQGKSVNEIVEEAAAVLVKNKKYNSTYVKIMCSVNECDELLVCKYPESWRFRVFYI